MNTLVITKRELSQFFSSPINYAVGAFFLFITGLSFFFTVALHNVATMSRVFYVVAVTLVFLAPLLTVRILSTETHSGTLELLLTTPIRVREVVVGKFLAAFLLLLIMITPTLIYLWLLSYYGNPDVPVVFSGYLGIILLGAMLISVGVLASALSSNPVVAIIISVVLAALFWAIGALGIALGGWAGYIFVYLSVQEHFFDFVQGLITTNNIVYFLSFTVGILFVTTRILEVKREH